MSQQSNVSKSNVVWIKLDGVLAVPTDPPSRWAIGDCLPHAPAVLNFVRDLGLEPRVFGEQCETFTGIRAVQRWLLANMLDSEVSYDQPPKGAEVIDQWPMKTSSE